MKQTDLKDHIIKSRIRPLTEKQSPQTFQEQTQQENLQDPSVSSGKPQQQIQKLENQPDSRTLSRQVVDRGYKTAFRVNRELWDLFVEDCKSKGLSSCHVLTCLIGKWLYPKTNLTLTQLHFTSQPLLSRQSYTIVQNLHFDRYVYKPRRVYRRKAGSNLGEVRVERRGSADSCGVCGCEKVVGVEHFWKDPDHNRECVETWVCESCHKRNVKRGFVHGFSNRKLETKKV